MLNHDVNDLSSLCSFFFHFFVLSNMHLEIPDCEMYFYLRCLRRDVFVGEPKQPYDCVDAFQDLQYSLTFQVVWFLNIQGYSK